MRSISRVTVLAAALLWMVGAQAQDKTDPNKPVDGKTFSFTCDEAGSASFNGSKNTIDVHGPCDMVVIKGDYNKVVIDVTANLQVSGNDNVVSWDASHIGSSEPKALVSGSRNSIKRQE